MEIEILKILKELAGDDVTSMQFYCILSVIVFLCIYKYFIKPILAESKRCITTIETQNKNIDELRSIIERLDKNVSELKKSSDEDYIVNQEKINQTKNDINEIKDILSQFKGAMMYNSRLFNKELS